MHNGVVVNVIVAEADFFKTFVDGSPGTWIQTSYNTRGGTHYGASSNTPDGGVALRGNYAGIGYIYDEKHDVFYPPQPFPSWTIAAPTWTWTPPVSKPTTGGPYSWNEATLAWVT
ncbi:MAG: hypothetical protein KGI37_07340 [Alphaproteobacteria bacterium]|nr:hypothetical protein [Alphaproteobacteria bacterium]